MPRQLRSHRFTSKGESLGGSGILPLRRRTSLSPSGTRISQRQIEPFWAVPSASPAAESPRCSGLPTSSLTARRAKRAQPRVYPGLVPPTRISPEGAARYGRKIGFRSGPCAFRFLEAPSGLRTFFWLTRGKPWAMFSWRFGPQRTTLNTYEARLLPG
jgi:hypothetical protein